jgi:hypothetical protein
MANHFLSIIYLYFKNSKSKRKIQTIFNIFICWSLDQASNESNIKLHVDASLIEMNNINNLNFYLNFKFWNINKKRSEFLTFVAQKTDGICGIGSFLTTYTIFLIIRQKTQSQPWPIWPNWNWLFLESG